MYVNRTCLESTGFLCTQGCVVFQLHTVMFPLTVLQTNAIGDSPQ